MRPFLALLVPSICLVQLTGACPLGHHHHIRDVNSANATNTLLPRVRIGDGSIPAGFNPPTSGDVFLLDSLAGGCASQSGTLNEWLQDADLLHGAIEQAYADAFTKVTPAMLMYIYFGINVYNGVQNSVDQALWKMIGDSIAGVRKFLDKGGIPNVVKAGENPRVFCSADAAQVVSFFDDIKDQNGKEAPTKIDPNTGVAEDYYTVGQVFQSMTDSTPFWYPAFNGYDFRYGTGQTSMCDPKGSTKYRVAVTGRPGTSFKPVTASTFTLGGTNRHILFCEQAFDTTLKGSHSFSSVTDAVSDSNYPTLPIDANTPLLNAIMPRSSTLYHELYHLTDNDDTADAWYQLSQITKRQPWPPTGAQNPAIFDKPLYTSNPDGVPGAQVAAAHNPETYTFLAMAAYMYYNPPSSKNPVFYAGGVAGPPDQLTR